MKASQSNLKERLKYLSPNTVFLIVIASIIFFIFFDFFTKGYVMDGISDRRNNVLPYYFIFSESFKNLEIPQWNPFLFCGNTLFSNSTYSFFYPFNWLIWSFPEKYIFILTTVVLTIHFFLAGYFAWLLFYELIKDNFWATCGSLTYLLSPAVMISLLSNTEQFSPFVYLPAILYLILTFHKRSLLSNFILQTAANALLLLGGMLQVVIYVIGFNMFFALFYGIKREESASRLDMRPFLTALASLLFAIMISAIRNIPFYLSTAENISFKLSYDEFLRINVTPLPALIRLFLPEFFVFLNRGEYFHSYTGIIAIFFGLYAFLIWDRKTIFWKIMIIVLTLVVIGTPLAYIHYFLTGKNNLAFGRLAWFIPICLSVLFSYIGKLIMEDKRHLRRLIIFSLCIFLFVTSFAIAAYNHDDPIIPAADYNEMVAKQGMRADILYFVVFFFLILGSLSFLALSKSDRKTSVFKAIIFMIILMDLMIFAERYKDSSVNPSFVPEPFYKSSFSEKEIAGLFEKNNRNFRILGFGEGTSYSRSISLNLYTSSGYESTPPFYTQNLYSYPYFLLRSMARHIAPQGLRALELSSTRYIIYDDNFVNEIPSSLPRYSLYNEYVITNDDVEAIETALGMRGDFDINKVVVLNSPPDIKIARSNNRGQIRLIKDGFNAISFEVIANENTLLLLNDTYDKGWKAYIDGEETRIIRANYAFRAVAVPAGIHKVQFSFTAAGFKEGKIISSIALLIFLSIVIFYFYQRRFIKSGSLQR